MEESFLLFICFNKLVSKWHFWTQTSSADMDVLIGQKGKQCWAHLLALEGDSKSVAIPVLFMLADCVHIFISLNTRFFIIAYVYMWRYKFKEKKNNPNKTP